MLSKKYRLNIKDFFGPQAPRPEKIARSSAFTVKIHKSRGRWPRFGVAIGKSVHARAVVRNRVKRTVMDFFRTNFNRFPVADYVCVMSPAAGKMTVIELRTELKKL